jgi:hypothetical protein
VYNPFAVFLLGAGCGLGMVAFAALAVWARRKETAMSLYERSRNFFFWGKLVVWAACGSVGCAAIAAVGAVDSTFALPHLEWPAGVLVGAGLPAGI